MKNFIERSFNHIQVGSKYGKITVLKTGQILDTYRYYALCQCDCGSKPKYIRIDNIKSGHTASCGCEQLISATKHGLWHNPLYLVYTHMVSRCYNPKDKRYPSYGGRGITVCDHWLNILNFIKDMEPSYKKGLTIDRIDNDKGYSPDNCHWATTKEQNRNYRKNINYTHNGKTFCLKEWSELLNISYYLLYDRLRVRNWSFKKGYLYP